MFLAMSLACLTPKQWQKCHELPVIPAKPAVVPRKGDRELRRSVRMDASSQATISARCDRHLAVTSGIPWSSASSWELLTGGAIAASSSKAAAGE